jgi:hypothetical protein
MGLKFKVGDIVKVVKIGKWPISNDFYNNFDELVGKSGKLIKIHNWKNPEGGFIDLYRVDFSKKIKTNHLGGSTEFLLREEHINLVESVQEISNPVYCPKCKGQECEGVYSDWAKSMVKKCPKCGYCN